MHDLELRRRALDLVAAGVNDCEVGRRPGVARTTVRQWRRAEQRDAPARALCWRCWRPTRRVELTAADYAELLGLNLGDGHISPMPRSQRLRLSLDAKYPTLIAEAEALLRRVFPACRVGRVVADGGSTVVLGVSRPPRVPVPTARTGQEARAGHGARGMAARPRAGGTVGLRARVHPVGRMLVHHRTGRYAYLSYEFRNWSTDILEIFVSTCAALGLHPRRYAGRVRLCRRADVAELLTHVGIES